MNFYTFVKDLSEREFHVLGLDTPFESERKSVFFTKLEIKFLHFVRSAPKEELKDELVFSKLNCWKRNSALLKAKSRIFWKILDRMCTDDFIYSEDVVDDLERGGIRVKKKLLQYKILTSKKNKTNMGTKLHILSELQADCVEYELFDTLSDVLDHKRHILINRGEFSEYKNLKEESEYYSLVSKFRNELNDFYYEFNSYKKFNQNVPEADLLNMLNDKLTACEKSPYVIVYSRIHYFYLILRLAKEQIEKNYGTSINTCLDLIGLIKSSKALNQKERLGMVYGNLAKNLILSRDFKRAAETAKNALSYFSPSSLNYLVTKEQEFLARFYEKNFSLARNALKIMLDHSIRESGTIRLDKYTLYSAYLDFTEGNFREALYVTNLSNTLSIDKIRWDLSIRYLKIMCLMELAEFDLVESAIEALRKQLIRSQNGEVAPGVRDEIIFKSLVKFMKSNFQEYDGTLHHHLKCLANKDTENSWCFYTHEIIPFHKWFKNFLNRNRIEYQSNKSKSR